MLPDPSSLQRGGQRQTIDDHEYATMDQLSNDRGKTHNEVAVEEKKKAKNEEKRCQQEL